jgi:hypothetical protein
MCGNSRHLANVHVALDLSPSSAECAESNAIIKLEGATTASDEKVAETAAPEWIDCSASSETASWLAVGSVCDLDAESEHDFVLVDSPRGQEMKRTAVSWAQRLTLSQVCPPKNQRRIVTDRHCIGRDLAPAARNSHITSERERDWELDELECRRLCPPGTGKRRIPKRQISE